MNTLHLVTASAFPRHGRPAGLCGREVSWVRRPIIRDMSTPERDELRKWSANLKPDEPLDVGDPNETRYVPLAEAGRGAVERLRAKIEMSFAATTQLLAGPSGAGKTTELYRLRRDLTEVGYQATVVDLTRYISVSSPVDVTEFLIAMAVGAHDALAPVCAGERPGFIARFGAFLRRLNIDLEIGGVTASVSGGGIEVGAFGSAVGLDLGAELKSSRPFVEELRQKLSYHLAQLYDEVAEFLRELLPAAETAGAVLVIDGLEKLRGTTANDLDVQKSVEAVFVNHAGRLKFSSHHLVYTVPTYLQFVAPGALPYDARRFVPVPHVRPRTAADAAAETNVAELRDVAARRVPVERVFGDGTLLDDVIDASGGHLRDLFRILRELIQLVWQLSLPLPVRPVHVEEAIRTVARDYAAMTAEQASFLRAVAAGDGDIQPRDDEVQLMARLVQSQLLLGHVNGEDWYEVHPLARRALGLR